jgi:NAD(P)-dependent dehydrogenase (short-subunit alcohol dehydrogenase family)
MGKHYAVIGGTSGIGQASVARLLASGHSLYAASRRPEILEQLGEYISAQSQNWQDAKRKHCPLSIQG